MWDDNTTLLIFEGKHPFAYIWIQTAFKSTSAMWYWNWPEQVDISLNSSSLTRIFEYYSVIPKGEIDTYINWDVKVRYV